MQMYTEYLALSIQRKGITYYRPFPHTFIYRYSAYPRDEKTPAYSLSLSLFFFDSFDRYVVPLLEQRILGREREKKRR